MNELILFIDDEPQDGPQHYILLLGFYQPHLIGALDAIGVHVANVISLCSEHTPTSGGKQEQHTCGSSEQGLDTGKEGPLHNLICVMTLTWFLTPHCTSLFPLCVCVCVLQIEGPTTADLAEQARKLDLFWTGLGPALDSVAPESRLHDVVHLSYTVPQLLCPTSGPEAEVRPGLTVLMIYFLLLVLALNLCVCSWRWESTSSGVWPASSTTV